jgi:hypothetical protein
MRERERERGGEKETERKRRRERDGEKETERKRRRERQGAARWGAAKMGGKRTV